MPLSSPLLTPSWQQKLHTFGGESIGWRWKQYHNSKNPRPHPKKWSGEKCRRKSESLHENENKNNHLKPPTPSFQTERHKLSSTCQYAIDQEKKISE